MTVRIEPAKLAWLEALTDSDELFTERFGIPVTPGWVGFPEALPGSLEAARHRDADPWGSHLIFDGGALVGFGGFKGTPKEDEVEIGYAVAPDRQGRGVATAAVRLLIAQARRAGVERVVAHTLAAESASTRLLSRCGFVNVATVPDPDVDVTENVWRWELTLRQSQ
jgi:RimJ/RimL family protein N-acetyltransferase